MSQRIIGAVLMTLALAGVSAAQTKISGSISCTKPDPAYMVEVGDRAGHTVGLLKTTCTWTTPLQIEGVATKDGVDVMSTDGTGAKSHTTGYHVSTLANGDKIFVRFSGSDTMTKDGKPGTSAGTWSFTGGTGKLKGITGKGTYKGKPDANGNMVSEIEGEYTLPAAK